MNTGDREGEGRWNVTKGKIEMRLYKNAMKLFHAALSTHKHIYTFRAAGAVCVSG